jgi:hypothetical protein
MDTNRITLHTSRLSIRRPRPQALALVAALAVGGAFTLAQAAATPPAAATTAAAKAGNGNGNEAMLKFSQAGHDAYAQIRQARNDIFDGHTDAALKAMKAAQFSLIAAKAEAPSFATSTRTTVMGKLVASTKERFTADAVPVDGDLVLSDKFQLSERHQPTLAKAKAHLARGDKTAAVETLKQGEIDVAYNRLWLPIAPAEKNLDKAIALATSGKFYDANLALKAIEDGVQVDIVRFDTAPAATS